MWSTGLVNQYRYQRSLVGARRRMPFRHSVWDINEDKPNAPVDYLLLFIIVTLVLFGLVIIYAATYHLGFRYLKLQAGKALLGFLALWLGSILNTNRLAQRKVRWFFLIFIVIILIATLIFGEVVGVAKRVLQGFQPAEIAKFILILWLAGYFAQLREYKPNAGFVDSIVKPGLVVGGVISLTLLQPAIGTSFIIALSSFIIFILAGVKWRYLFLVGLFTTLAILVGLLVVIPGLKKTQYRYIPDRLEKFRNGDRYQQVQALIALGSGGPLGRGLGEGRQKYYFLPKLHKDFIFCSIGEEFGFFGCLVIMGLYLLFLIRCLRIGQQAPSDFGYLLTSGIATTIFLYAVVHQAVALSVIPTTGQPLPFISYGGSALLANLFAAGMVLKVSRYRTFRPFVGTDSRFGRNGIGENFIGATWSKGFNGGGWNRWAYFPRARSRS
ncbi:MAG: FtsW/RodA/SpoVE family cell cycle protein [candidate division WOR-3 bacterium]